MRQTSSIEASGCSAEEKRPLRCVQTGGVNGPITQGRFNGCGIYLPSGVWAWSIDDRYVPGKLIDQHPKPPRPPALPQRTICEVAA